MREIAYQDHVSNRIIMRRQQPCVRDEAFDNGANKRLADKRGIRKILFHFSALVLAEIKIYWFEALISAAGVALSSSHVEDDALKSARATTIEFLEPTTPRYR